MLTPHLHLMPGLIMRGGIPPALMIRNDVVINERNDNIKLWGYMSIEIFLYRGA